ncbi:GTP-binding protein REM 1-like [Amphibalanus amphitrite]|uniref:GTP-binding protein REM 1-like n=1 Tax=Amphibalanus amphitrite TaxID=1232801 RepID=UPI001C91818C|nr:GTP-binding protein REM 1-like [Amphibalanus amphitrite]
MRADTGRPGQHAMACWVEDGGAGGAPHHLRRRSSQLEVEPRVGSRPARPSSPRPIPAARRVDTFPPNSCASRSPSPSPFDEGSPAAAARRNSRHSLAASPCRAAAVLRDWQEEFALPEFRPRSSSVAVPARRAQLTRGHRVPERHAGWLDPSTASAPQRRAAARSPDVEPARVRSFVTTSRGVVSRGDSTPRDLAPRHSTPPTTPASSLTSSGRTSPALSQSPPTGPPAPASTPTPPAIHHVVPLGGAGVGKTALVRQFLSSEYMNGYDTAGGLGGAPALTVYVDERETRLVFEEPAGAQLEELADTGPAGGPVSAFLVIYSVTDAASFSEAASLLLRLYTCGAMYRHVVILVGNKADLVRARVVSTAEGRHLAMAHGCKFIECSGGMNHRVDELLAGLASQLRLRADGAGRGCQRRRGSLGFLDKLLHRQSHSKSCQNLFT